MTTTIKSPAAKFRKSAESLVKKIEHLRRPMTQNSTPKRQKEYASRVLDGDNLERGRLALLALADLWEYHEVADVPECLRDLSVASEVCRLVRHGIDHSSYYSLSSTGRYADTSERGISLQKVLEDSLDVASRNRLKKTDEQRDLEQKIEKVRFSDIPGFFPTPDAVIDQMIQLADVLPTHKILEPSAGIGSICDRLVAHGIPAGSIVCCEVWPSLCDILEAKKYLVVRGDFLEQFSNLQDGWGYDRIIANPPFERGQDIEHSLHAFAQLKPNGRLVSIMSNSFTFRTDVKSLAFRDWLKTVDHEIIDLPDGSFSGAKAFRQTGVACKILVVNKE